MPSINSLPESPRRVKDKLFFSSIIITIKIDEGKLIFQHLHFKHEDRIETRWQ